jgi:hypothetical protein
VVAQFVFQIGQGYRLKDEFGAFSFPLIFEKAARGYKNGIVEH